MSSSRTETLVEVTMPQMGVSVAEGTIVTWHKHPGDWVEADETVCEISTDKIDTELPSPATGRLVRILVQETVRRFPRMAPDGEPTWVVSQFSSQLKTLPVRLHG